MWIQPCRPQEEREHRRTINQARRFLHLEREKAGLPTKAAEHGVDIPIVGGKYYPIPKANITWRGMSVASIAEGVILWASDEVLAAAFGKELIEFTSFRAAWVKFLA